MTRQSMSPLILTLVLATLGQAATLGAQEITPESARAAITRVFELSQQAKSREAYGEIIQQCEQITAADLDKKKTDYANKLAAWAYNRRGEERAELAAALAKKGENEQADQLDSQALADFNKSLELDASKWKAYHNRGVSNAVAGEYESALADFTKASALEPEYSNTWFNRGEIQFEQGKYQKAIEDYNQALRLKPGDLGARSRRGRAYVKAQQYEEALADFTTVLQVARQDAETYVDRADAYALLGKWQQAASDYRQAIRLDQNLGRAYRGAAWLMATSTDEQFRNPLLALQAARKSVEIDGREDYRNLDTLAAALANAGQFEQAIVEGKAAVEMAPVNKQAELKARVKMYEAEEAYRES